MGAVLQRNESQAPADDRRARYRADIQGMRAIAVLAVIANHFAGWPKGSFVGVDVFFVISGYLITGILVREFETRQTISFSGFYARRIKRILPAGLFVIGATLCATRVLAGIDRYHFAAKDAIAAVLFSANWHFAETGINYFNQSLPPSPLQHYWSLSVEEQFYFVWPWLMLGLLLTGLRLRFWRHEHARLVAGVAIAVISGVSLAWAFAETAAGPDGPRTSPPSSGPGSWAWGRSSRSPPRRFARCDARLRRVVALAGLLGVLVSLFVVPSSSGVPAPWALLPTLGTAAVLGAGAGLSGRSLLPLTNPVSQYVGKISYSLYLWHFPVVVLIVAVVPRYSAAYWLAGLALIFGLSAASFHLLEDPARRGTWFRQRPGRVSCPRRRLAAIRRRLRGHRGPRRSRPPRRQGHQSDPTCPPGAGPGRAYPGRSARLHRGGGARSPPPLRELNTGDRVAPLPGELPDDTGGAYACYAYLRQPIRPCEYGSRRPDAIRVALIGDSHAAALLAALEPQLDALNWRVTAFTGQTCGWLPPALSPECPGLRLIQRALLHRHYAVVIATEIRVYTSSVADHLEAMRPVAATGARIVVVEDDPSVSPASTACVTRITYSATGDCGTPVSVAYRDPDRLAAGRRTDPRGSRRHHPAVLLPRRVLPRHDRERPRLPGHRRARHRQLRQTVSPYLVEAIERALPVSLR